METQKGHNVPFLESASFKKRKRNAMKRIKKIYKISKKGNKKKGMQCLVMSDTMKSNKAVSLIL